MLRFLIDYSVSLACGVLLIVFLLNAATVRDHEAKMWGPPKDLSDILKQKGFSTWLQNEN